jgi:hypothetical protein
MKHFSLFFILVFVCANIFAQDYFLPEPSITVTTTTYGLSEPKIKSLKDTNDSEINNCIIEINERALAHDIAYFLPIVWNYEHPNMPMPENNPQEFQDLKNLCNLYISDIIKINLPQTYKERSFYTKSGVHLNYHWDEQVNLQMFIKKINNKWTLTEIDFCL